MAQGRELLVPVPINGVLQQLLDLQRDLLAQTAEIVSLALVRDPAFQRASRGRVVLTQAAEFGRTGIEATNAQFVRGKPADNRRQFLHGDHFRMGALLRLLRAWTAALGAHRYEHVHGLPGCGPVTSFPEAELIGQQRRNKSGGT